MISLQIVDLHGDNCNVRRLIDSFEGLLLDWHLYSSYYELAEKKISNAPWYGVFYSDEYIDRGLRIGLSSMMLMHLPKIDCFSFFKLEKCGTKATFAPRLFKREVDLNPEFLFPLDPHCCIERLLDGHVIGA